ncbi:hypothetical protein HU762_22920 [Pseudomonas sp. SWRI92]|uniref:hypothetical protein n=1 Tax=Pseudomonas sp. SWRI92 TaxID=2745499 RepID=UPI0016452BB5|nr:hypothetical protein [Pseudomonas sp. SWRI92]MBC3376799.1 hypothetical protein [Pseudomonas sp. SWRI92]
MKSNNRRTIFRVQQVASLGLLSLMALIYADSAFAATYICKYVDLAGVTQGGPLTIIATSTVDAMNQAKPMFQSQGKDISKGWIICAA